MPEGHILHRLAREITRKVGGVAVRSSSPQGRFSSAHVLDGRVVGNAWAHGKHLFVPFEGLAEQVHVHLGIYGALTITDVGELPIVGQVRWRMQSADHTFDLRGPSRCELLGPVEVEEILDRLGPDPLDSGADPAPAFERIRRSRLPIAQLLMDQRVLAGVGNVYRAEVLFRHGLDPYIPGNEFTREAFDLIWADLVVLMADGMEKGRIDTVRPEHEPEAMGRPPRQDDHGGEVYVYRRALMPCLVCETPVSSATLANRNVYWCPECQSAD